MTELEHQKELLKTRIDVHRTVVGLEARAARAAFDPLGMALSLVGFDRGTVEVLGPILHAVASNLVEHVNGDGASDAG